MRYADCDIGRCDIGTFGGAGRSLMSMIVNDIQRHDARPLMRARMLDYARRHHHACADDDDF
jgi:hypothetical protein